MPISGVNANPYAPIVESTQGLATLGDLVDYKAKLDAAKALTAERNSQTAFRNQEVADRQRAAQESARTYASVEAIKQKHLRGDGSLDQTGFMTELSATEPEAAAKIGKAMHEANTGLLDDQKFEREKRADVADQLDRLTRGTDKDPELLARNLPQIRALKPDAADYIADGDPAKIENLRNQTLDYKSYVEHVKEIEKATDSAKGRAYAQLVAARTPDQIDMAFKTIHAVGGDHDMQNGGVYPGHYNPETDRAFVLSQIPGLTDEQRAKFAIPATAAVAKTGDVNAGSFEDYVLRYAKEKGKPPEAVTTGEIQQLRKAYMQADDKPLASANPEVAADKAYNVNKTRLDALRKPVDDSSSRMSNLLTSINSSTPAADALVAPELMTVLAGGSGSGVRITETEINRVMGGRSNLESVKAALYKWTLDPTKALSITPAQRGQIRALAMEVKNKADKKLSAIQQADADLLDAKTPDQQRRIVAKLQKDVEDITQDSAGAAGGSGSAGAVVKWGKDAAGNPVRLP